MDSRIVRLARQWRRRGLALVAAALFALSAVGGVGASTPNVPIDPGTPTTAEYTERRCLLAVANFDHHVRWLLDYIEDHPDGGDPNDPDMTYHRDAMWAFWYIAEYECGIDVGGDGEIG